MSRYTGGFESGEVRYLKQAIQNLKVYARQLRSLLQKYIERTRKLHQQLMQARAKIKDFGTPPNYYAVFVRPHPGGRPEEVDVLQDRSFKKVVLAVEGLTAKDLKCGWEVLLNNEKNAVIEVTRDYWHWGEAVTFREWLNDDSALVVNQSGAVSQCYISPDLKGTELKPGDLLLDCNNLLVKALPKTEEKERFKDLEEISQFNWSKVGGISGAVKNVQRALLPFKEAEVWKNVYKGSNLSRGLILHGPPGCGKTLVAKCIAADLGRYRGLKCYFMPLVGAELLNKWLGNTEEKIRALFDRAKERAGKDAMVLIFIDELDSLFKNRSAAIMEKESWQSSFIGQFCGILDGMEELGNIFVIGASNHKHLIDAAILRPGRLGEDVEIPRPKTKKDVAEILRIHFTPDSPFAQEYFEDDKHEYMDYFGSGNKRVVRLDKDREKIQQHFINIIIRRLFYDGKPVRLVFDGETVTITSEFTIFTEKGKEVKHLKDCLSGAALAGIVETAKKFGIERYVEAKEKLREELRTQLAQPDMSPEQVTEKVNEEVAKRLKPDLTEKDFYRAVEEELKRLKHGFKQPEKESKIGFHFGPDH